MSYRVLEFKFADLPRSKITHATTRKCTSAASQLNFRVDTFQNDQYAELPWIDNPNF
jgi:hypothetical protein